MIGLRSYVPYYQTLGRLGTPIVVGQLGTIVLAFADTLMIGHHSTVELAAAAFVNTVFTLVLVFALGFSYAITPMVGTLFGRGEHGRVGAVVRNALLANLLLAAVLMVVCGVVYLNVDRLGQPEELLPYIRPYFIIQLVSLPFVCGFNAYKQFADGITDTALPMVVIILGNLLNIFGNWVLIYGVFGLPELGLVGAGLSTLFSRMVMMAMLAGVFFFQRKYRDYALGFKAGKINGKDMKNLLRMGIPLAIQMGTETAAFSLSGIMVGWLGTTQLAAHQVMLTISQLGFMVYYGVGAATAVRVSYFVGQREYVRAGRTAYAALHIVLALSVAISIPLFLSRHVIGYLFTDNAEVAMLVSTVLLPFVVYQFGDSMQIVFANASRGLSHVRPLMYIAIFSYFIVSLPVGYLLGIEMGFGLRGIWFAFPFGLTVAGVLYWLAFRKKLLALEGESGAVQ